MGPHIPAWLWSLMLGFKRSENSLKTPKNSKTLCPNSVKTIFMVFSQQTTLEHETNLQFACHTIKGNRQIDHQNNMAR